MLNRDQLPSTGALSRRDVLRYGAMLGGMVTLGPRALEPARRERAVGPGRGYVPNPGGGTVPPAWSEEWDRFALVGPRTPEALWAAGVDDVAALHGAKDPAGLSWDANPNEDFGGEVGRLDPFAHAPVRDARGAPSHGRALTFTLDRATPAQQDVTGFANWGPFLQTNAGASLGGARLPNGKAVAELGVGMYIEVRYLFRGRAPTMWPAIWMYGAQSHATGGGSLDPAYATAEIDILEYCSPVGYTTVWWDQDAARTPEGWNLFGAVDDVWHVAGVDWQHDSITFYRDGRRVGAFTDRQGLAWLDRAPMGLRFDYTVLADEPVPTRLSFSVDNVRVWRSFAASRGR